MVLLDDVLEESVVGRNGLRREQQQGHLPDQEEAESDSRDVSQPAHFGAQLSRTPRLVNARRPRLR
jgi:hypothetical protein